MTTTADLVGLADRFKDAIDTNMMDGTARRTLHRLVDELRTFPCCDNVGTYACHCNEYKATQLRTAASGVGEHWLIDDMERTIASIESMWQSPVKSDFSAQFDAGRDMAYMTVGNSLRDTLNEWKQKLSSPPGAEARDAADAERFRWLMSEQADMVWAPYLPGRVRWSFIIRMPDPDVSAENLGPGTVKAELIAAIDDAAVRAREG